MPIDRDEFERQIAQEGLSQSGEYRIRVGYLEEQIEYLKESMRIQIDPIAKDVRQVREELAHLRGWVAGYMIAGVGLGGLVMFILSKVFH